MPSRMMHYCIGKEILKSVKWDEKLFAIGNLSPDAHDGSPHGIASSHYNTSYRFGIDNYPVVDLEVFRYKYLSGSFDDFTLGYYCHLITDNLWSESIYYEYLECHVDEINSRVEKCYEDYVTLNKILVDHFSLNKTTLEIPSHISIDEITIENLIRVAEALYDDFELYQRLVFANSYTFLIIKVKKVLKDTILEKYNDKLNMSKDLYNLYAEYTASGVMSLYIEWFKTNSKLSLEDLAKVVGNISFNGVRSILIK